MLMPDAMALSTANSNTRTHAYTRRTQRAILPYEKMIRNGHDVYEMKAAVASITVHYTAHYLHATKRGDCILDGGIVVCGF
jgi:hypothetical protein